jgi:hypothetical protein
MTDWQSSFKPAQSSSTQDWQGSFQPNSYGQNVAQDFSSAMNQIGQKWANKDDPNSYMFPPSADLQLVSDAATGAYAPLTEAVKSGYKALPSDWTQPINDAASAAMQKVKTGGEAIGDYLMNSPKAMAASNFLDSSPKLQQGMQEYTNDAKALANLMTLGVGKSVLGDASMAVGDKLLDSGMVAKSAVNDTHIEKLLRGKPTPTQLTDDAKNTIVVNGKNIYQPPADELSMAKTAKEAVPGFGNSMTPQGNLSAAIAKKDSMAQELKSTLEKNGAKVDISGSWQPNIDQAIEKATENPVTVVREGAEAHQGAIDSMNKAVLKNMSPDGTLTAAGLLQARKDFDQMLPPRTFTGPYDTALGNTAKQLRNAMNKTIAEADPAAGVAESLNHQSNLYNIIDTIAPKAAGEAATPFGRAMQSMKPHNLMQAVGGAGMGAAALAAAHYLPISPAMVGAALVPAAAYKAATSPSTRILLGKALGGGQ